MVDELVRLLDEHVAFPQAMPDVRLRRLDVASDFIGVPSPALILDAISTLRSQRPMTTLLYRDPDLIGAQTVYRKNTRWSARLYHRGGMYQDAARSKNRDRNLELADVEAGVVRLEFELRGEVLDETGLSSLDMVEPARVWQTASKFWERCGFGGSIGSDATHLARAREELGWQELALLVSRTLFPEAAASRGTARKAKALAAEYPLSADDFNQRASIPSGHLSLRSGRFLTGRTSVSSDHYELAS
ncbi:hypothetical protein [Isoptericola sp. NPDC056134]|uniref:hypothetical protein n=1 Tax=Isoptericola sp. NPDC056134 TaxID=3345723 RepID=UPI0035E709D3